MDRPRSGLVGVASVLTALTLLTAGCNQMTATGPGVRMVAVPGSITAIVGESAETTVTIAPVDGFSGSVTLSLRTSTGQLAPGLTLSPDSVTLLPGRSVTFPLTLAVADSLRAGTEALALSAAHNDSTQAIPLELVLDYSGTFGTATTYDLSSNGSLGSASVAARDVSGDGVPDVELAGSQCPISTGCTSAGSYEGTVWVLLNNGSGSFPTFTAYPAGSGNDPMSVALADVTGNDFLDVITAGEIGSSSTVSSGAVGVLPNDGNASFGYAATYDTGGGGSTPSAAVADVDGDGLPDIVAVDASDPGKISLLRNTGSGTFGSPTSYPTGVQVVASVAVADVDGDGHPDVVTASNDTGGGAGIVSVLHNTGNGTFAAPETYTVDNSSYEHKLSVAVGDLNGDGQPDLVVIDFMQSVATGSYVGAVWVMLNHGDGTFGTPTRYLSSAPATQGDVAVADVNGDGHPDIVTASNYYTPNINGTTTDSGEVAVLLNQGDGTFGTATAYPTGVVSSESVAVADVNGDGKPDVITGNYGTPVPLSKDPQMHPNSISILLGQ